MDIQDMRIFARVAAIQNLSAVGTELGLTPGTISKRIQALETELSARLFDRTTRSIRITEEGVTFLAHVERILAELDAARASVDDKVGKPKGKLRIAAPTGLGRRHLVPGLSAFLAGQPEIEAQLDLRDGPVNLQEDGYDLAIRTGTLPDSSLIAKRLAPDRYIIAAAPSYLAKRGRPMRPDELREHNCLVASDRVQWPFVRDGAETVVRVCGSFRSNDAEVLCQAALEGAGLVRASELEILPELASGRLVQVLGDHNSAGNVAVWAVYSSARHMLPRMRVLLDFLTEWFREARGRAGNGQVAPRVSLVRAGVASALGR